MLVFSRKRNEKIVIDIGGGITIMIVDIRGDQVQVGIDADRSIPVDREEVARDKADGVPPRSKRDRTARKQ